MSDKNVPRSLDLVTAVATQLMAANAATSVRVSQHVLADLVDYFDVDVAFPLQRPQHSRVEADRGMANQPDIPTPIRWPLSTSQTPIRYSPSPSMARNRWSSARSRPPMTTNAVSRKAGTYPRPRWLRRHWYQETSPRACWVSSSSVTGWKPEELNALEAIASLFAQVQARVLAEDRLRFLAEHDDLTGLHNRRALLAHLDARLAGGQPDPSALFFDSTG